MTLETEVFDLRIERHSLLLPTLALVPLVPPVEIEAIQLVF